LIRLACCLTGALACAACVDNFTGSKIELLLHGGVDVPGDTAAGGAPPTDTHYEIWVTRDQAAFHIVDFEIHPVISTSDPCFIEEAGARFAGLHSTQIVKKLVAVATDGGRTPTPQDAADIELAKIRVGYQPQLEATLKVFTLHEPGLTQATITQLTADVPPANQIDDASNADRLAKCQAVWRQHPGYYVATDKVLTLPLNGTYYGIVQGMDPRNQALLGGGSIDVDASFPEFDALRISWDWNDPNDTRKGNYPPTNTGHYYMAGPPVMIVRGVINVSLVNEEFSRIGGEASIFTDLGRDDVHF
jgi:hypothetical protein